MFARIHLFVLLFGLLQSCSSSSSPEKQTTSQPNIVASNSSQNIFQDGFDQQKEIYDQVFPWIMDSTFYTDPNLLIEQLGVFYGHKNTDKTTIVNFERQQLYGLTDSIWFLNCKITLDDYGCTYPTMHTQYLFNHQGKLIHKNQAAVAQFVPAVIDSLPIYMSLNHDCQGNGQHHFYIYQQGKLIDVFNVLMNDSPKTYDANPDKGMFRKKHLDFVIQDSNNDGYNDILLTGKWLVLENKNGKKAPPNRPFKAEKVAYHFIYKPTKEYFLLEQLNPQQ